MLHYDYLIFRVYCICHSYSSQIAYERSVKDSDILNARLQKLQQDFEAQLIACDGLNQENQGKAMELKVNEIYQ